MVKKLTPVEGLKLALSKEEESIELYKKLGADNPVSRETFDFLENEEFKHKKLIEKKIYELTGY